MPGGPTQSMRPAELDPRGLLHHQHSMGGGGGVITPASAAATTPSAGLHLVQVDVSTQVDLHDGPVPRGATPLYSREDIKEQYCITNRQLDAVEKSGSGIFGCLTSRGPSPCSSSAKASILSACVRSAPSDENLFTDAAPYPFPPNHHRLVRRQMHPGPPPLHIMYQHQPYSTYPRHMPRYDNWYNDRWFAASVDDDDWIDNSYFRPKPKPFCTLLDTKRYAWLPEDEEPTRPERPRSVLSTTHPQPLAPAIHTPGMTPQQQSTPGSQTSKSKHVSFARSHTLTSFDIPRTKSPPRPQQQERLIDSQPSAQPPVTPGVVHAYPQPEPRILVLEKQPKRGTMKAQATQTEVPAGGVRGRIPVTLSPRTIHRVKMVSQGAQTNGIVNGRKLTKSFSEAGQLSTPLGGPLKEEQAEHEPLQRTQSEEPPRSPFMVDNTPPRSPATKDGLPNGDVEHKGKRLARDLSLDDEEILIDFKPAPVSPDARALLEEMAQPYRRYVTLQKTLSDGEIQVERRELVGEAGEPSYPHTCRRNHPDHWSVAGSHQRKLLRPVQFSSTPEDLSLLRVSPPDEHDYEEFHENLVRRGLFRKRSVSLEDGVQGTSTNEFILPRSLPTSPTSPTSATAPSRRGPREGMGVQRHLLRAVPSPFASSDSLANDLTRDHSDGGIWNESQATVLQADSLSVLTPSSKRRHLLMLQHQQRSSMDTDALDAEDEMDAYASSPRIRFEAATPVTVSHSIETTIGTTTNGSRPRLGVWRRSPGPSQSSSEFGLSRSGTTDISETSTTDDYITANTSTGTGTTTGGTSAPTTTSSLTRAPHLSIASGHHQGPTSATATVADGSSFESASSIYSLARSEAIPDDTSSPRTPKDKSESSYGLIKKQHQASPARSSSSSSSGSYDLEDAAPDSATEAAYKSAASPGAEQDPDEGHHSSSGGYAESPPDRHGWTDQERQRRKKGFTLDFPAGLEASTESSDIPGAAIPGIPTTGAGRGGGEQPSSSPNHRHRTRAKSAASRSPHRGAGPGLASKRRSLESQQQLQQQLAGRSPPSHQRHHQQEELTCEDPGHVPTSDDSSCSHHYHAHHHHHQHHHASPAVEHTPGRHPARRTRDSPRRKSSSYSSSASRRRSNEDKNAALTGSLPRRRTRGPAGLDHSPSLHHLSPASSCCPRHQSPSPEATTTTTTSYKALSAESLRSASPGSDSVFYSIEDTATPSPAGHCHQCGREVSEEIVQPPAGFADSPEGMHRPSSSASKQGQQRLFKKFDKRYRSEDRSERRHHRSSISRSDVRAKSEERGGTRSSGRYGEDFSRRRLQARSTDASMEILTGREDEDAYVEPYSGAEWIYIGDFEESHVWRRPDSRDGDDELEVYKERRGSHESTESEKSFRKKYQAATHRMVHRKSSGEMYKRIQTKCFESDKRVVVRREVGGEFGFRIHGSKPVVVSAIEPDTPAESSGLEVGDIIMSVNGKSVMEATHSEVVRLAHSGTDVLELEVARTCNVLAPHVGREGQAKEAKQEPALCSGYLWRKSRSSSSSMDKWVRRWFALRRDNCLYYYKTDTDSQPIGAVMLLKYDVEQTHESRPHSFAIRKHGAPTLHLAADSDDIATRWCLVIQEAVERNSQADTWLDTTLKLQQLPPYMIQRADCFGYLSKQHERVRRTSSPTGWSRRYCVLKDAALYFYDDANAEQAFGMACLHGFRVHSGAPSSGGRKHAFELQPPDPTQRIYIFAADSEMDKKRWLAALEYSIDRWIKIG